MVSQSRDGWEDSRELMVFYKYTITSESIKWRIILTFTQNLNKYTTTLETTIKWWMQVLISTTFTTKTEQAHWIKEINQGYKWLLIKFKNTYRYHYPSSTKKPIWVKIFFLMRFSWNQYQRMMSDKRWWTKQHMTILMDLNLPRAHSPSLSRSRHRWRCSPLERAPSATTPPPRLLSVMPAAALPLAHWSVSLPRPSQTPAPAELNVMCWKWVIQKVTSKLWSMIKTAKLHYQRHS